MTSHFGCLHDVMRLACDVRLSLFNNNNNNNDKSATPTVPFAELSMADNEQMLADDCQGNSEKNHRRDREVDEELLFDLEINRGTNGSTVSSITGEDSDSESFHTCDNSSDLENEQTTSSISGCDTGSEDSGFTSRRSRFAKLKIDINKKKCDDTATNVSSSQETSVTIEEVEIDKNDNPQNAIAVPPSSGNTTELHECTSTSSSWNESASFWDLVDANSPIYNDEEFRFNREDLRRSSSLKADKTPPDTPRRKKVVRFADTLGLDLESVRHILNLDSPPRIPLSAKAHLQPFDPRLALPDLQSSSSDLPCRYLSAQFPQPGASENFLKRVKDQLVCLENAMITDMTITGTVRVANISYHKAVKVRYTVNNWVTFTDVHSNYVPNSCDGPTDRFSFSIVAPSDMPVGGKLSFCICYSVDGNLYWDSNFGQNYNIECYQRSFPSSHENAWMHFMC